MLVSKLPSPNKIPGTPLGVLVVLGTALFNPILAVLNAHVIQIGPTAVILCELSLDLAAFLIILRAPTPEIGRWIAFTAIISMIGISNSLGSQSFDPKFFRDILIIPIYILLGQSMGRPSIIRVVIPLQCIVTLLMIYEAVRPEDFGNIFNVMGYYINTRGFQEEQFWSATTGDLFVSAARPGDRFLLPILDIHRLSSVFLEPVSLGNYCVIISIFVASFWKSLHGTQKWFLTATSALILVGCDGRFATISILIMVAIVLFATYLPRFSNVIYLPGVVALSFIAVVVLNLSPDGDDFPSRTAGSILAISAMDGWALIGYRGSNAYQVMDSGVAYLLYSQSLIGAAAIWLSISLGLPQSSESTTRFAHGVSIYVALNLLISYSLFSVKTAGLLWFISGAVGRELVERAQILSGD